MRPVTEEQRIDIAVQLREFQARASRASRSAKTRLGRLMLPFLLRRRALTRASPSRRVCRTTTAPWCMPSAARRVRQLRHAACHDCATCLRLRRALTPPRAAAWLHEQEPRQGRHALRDGVQGAPLPRRRALQYAAARMRPNASAAPAAQVFSPDHRRRRLRPAAGARHAHRAAVHVRAAYVRDRARPAATVCSLLSHAPSPSFGS
jgi:hypothetical protein